MSFKFQNNQRQVHSSLILKLALPILLFTSYSFTHSKTTGDEKLPKIRREIKLGGTYESISVTGNTSIVLTNEPAGTVTIEGNEYDFKRVLYVLTNNKLSINVNDMIASKQSTVYISALSLKNLELDGDGDITSTDPINSDYLHVFLNGIITAKIQSKGKLDFDTPDDMELHKKFYKVSK